VRQYHITGVPKTIVNGQGEILGALPEAQFLEQILVGLGSGSRAPRRSRESPET
jgi:hypothetical protein